MSNKEKCFRKHVSTGPLLLGSFQDQPPESTVESVRRAGKEAADETVDLVTGVGILLGTALGLPMGDVGNTNEVRYVAALLILSFRLVYWRVIWAPLTRSKTSPLFPPPAV